MVQRFVSTYGDAGVIKVAKHVELYDDALCKMWEQASMTKHSTLVNVAVFIIGVFVPIVGHILDTFLIIRDGHRWSGKALWLLVVWLFPFVGPLLYMLFGQTLRKDRYNEIGVPNHAMIAASGK
jgi:hypothetical protein